MVKAEISCFLIPSFTGTLQVCVAVLQYFLISVKVRDILFTKFCFYVVKTHLLVVSRKSKIKFNRWWKGVGGRVIKKL